MFFKKNQPQPVEVDTEDQTMALDPRLLEILDGLDPEILRVAVQSVTQQKVLSLIERDLAKNRTARAALAKQATALVHQRETLLGQVLSDVAKHAA